MSNVEILANLYEAFGRGDIETVLGEMDPEIRWHVAEGHPYLPSGEALVGPEAILNNLFVRIGEEWEEFVVHTNAFHDAGDVVVVEGRYTGKYKPTGKSLDAQVCHLWKVEDGKVTGFQQYVDTAQYQAVTGA